MTRYFQPWQVAHCALAVLLACAMLPVSAGTEPSAPADLRPPRLLAGADAGPEALRERVGRDGAKASMLEALKSRVQPYVERHRGDPAWIVSRLQMYWQARHTQVYVKNGYYDHASGAAPVPTVRFTGARDTATDYQTPKLEDVKPYMGENDLLYLQRKNAPGQPWEWVTQAKTGRIVESINMRIAELARDAAFLYWYTGDEAYAGFAYDIFDTYMSGLYHREMPVDLNQGHDQTLVGLQSFEVIHEDIAGPLAESYDFMRGYVAARAGGKRALYDAAFKKWADIIIANGVPWNNWNLIKARFVLQIAAILGKDDSYADRRGSEHYVQAVIDGKGARQWSLRRLLDFGYDDKTAMWNESAGYSVNVADDYLECLEMLDRLFGIDLLPQMPVLPRAALALPQYLLPNGRTVGFGDSRYDLLRTVAVERLLHYAERHGRDADARSYAALLAAMRAATGVQGSRAPGSGVHALFSGAPSQGAAIPGAPSITDYQTPTFFAPNASWLIQRNGYQGAHARDNALVISQAGSAGNHAHANGIAMELYAQGISIAPESGRGSGYFQHDHREYYSQFPAHNTVVVDGVSTYPSMKSNHPMAVQAVYPRPGSPATAAFPNVTFSDVAFREPETDAEQRRVLGTVRLDDKSGYFVDIFRSRRRDGKDKYHDYIYHNLGQTMAFSTASGQALATAPSQRLVFADGDLIGYDYWSGRRSLASTQPLKARFDLKLPDRAVAMTAWLQGAATREFFSVQAPPSTAWPSGMLPAGVDKLPMQTLVVRQSGEAWTRPFTAVFEAMGNGTPDSVLKVEEIIPEGGAGRAAGLRVTATGERRQTIMSNDGDGVTFAHGGQRLVGRYGIAAERGGELDYLFLGHGREVAGLGYAIAAAGEGDGASAALWRSQGRWLYTASRPARLRVPAAAWPAGITLRGGGGIVRISGRAAVVGGRRVRIFDMPAMAATTIR
ncbi:heparinase II/III domain-containing protein [Pseudoduganella namucuonensis]|uniref:Heparinase II/III-like protein n=1 Tax=Pseudoduganella namucuonensis TaxID=1035707 RepID=A0A1I7H6J4_9BURK|nr:heparinase II/III family protein [Pseudoduganella namucuonensis]SFU56285.1 Heparinase II/III-like protein [Pseudoduganella namucuonensis]